MICVYLQCFMGDMLSIVHQQNKSGVFSWWVAVRLFVSSAFKLTDGVSVILCLYKVEWHMKRWMHFSRNLFLSIYNINQQQQEETSKGTLSETSSYRDNLKTWRFIHVFIYFELLMRTFFESYRTFYCGGLLFGISFDQLLVSSERCLKCFRRQWAGMWLKGGDWDLQV